MDRAALWENSAVSGDPERFGGVTGKVAFHNALRELLERRLIWTDYRLNEARDNDIYGIHATKLGWCVIERIWQHDPDMRMPKDAPTGPNIP
jgi:hypothetical protein